MTPSGTSGGGAHGGSTATSTRSARAGLDDARLVRRIEMGGGACSGGAHHLGARHTGGEHQLDLVVRRLAGRDERIAGVGSSARRSPGRACRATSRAA
jgi:hypothetical protein